MPDSGRARLLFSCRQGVSGFLVVAGGVSLLPCSPAPTALRPLYPFRSGLSPSALYYAAGLRSPTMPHPLSALFHPLRHYLCYPCFYFSIPVFFSFQHIRALFFFPSRRSHFSSFVPAAFSWLPVFLSLVSHSQHTGTADGFAVSLAGLLTCFHFFSIVILCQRY